MSFVTNKELIESGIKLEIFNYQDLSSDLVDLYSSYENRFKILFEDYSEIHKLKKCFFFLKNSIRCNALASRCKGYNIIGITIGYPILMDRKFKKDFFENIVLVGLINERAISDAYCDLYEAPNFNLRDFLLDCSIAFTFHHEFRHILQFNCSQSNENYHYSENLDKENFDINRHAREFDADRIAAFEVLKIVFSAHRKLGDINDTKFMCLLYLALSSIVITKNLFYFNA